MQPAHGKGSATQGGGCQASGEARKGDEPGADWVGAKVGAGVRADREQLGRCGLLEGWGEPGAG
jgi:hypothetical protein